MNTCLNTCLDTCLSAHVSYIETLVQELFVAADRGLCLGTCPITCLDTLLEDMRLQAMAEYRELLADEAAAQNTNGAQMKKIPVRQGGWSQGVVRSNVSCRALPTTNAAAFEAVRSQCVSMETRGPVGVWSRDLGPPPVSLPLKRPFERRMEVLSTAMCRSGPHSECSASELAAPAATVFGLVDAPSVVKTAPSRSGAGKV